MNSLARSYSIYGFELTVEVGAASLLNGVELVLGSFATPVSGDEDYNIVIAHGRVPGTDDHPTGLQVACRTDLPDGTEVVCYASDGIQQIDLKNLATMHVDHVARQVKMTVAKGAEWCVGRGCMAPLLCELLGRAGQHAVHAACLQVEHRDDHRAIIIAGQSGRGKTTTSLALGYAGLKLMGDDTCFVSDCSDNGGGLSVWGLLLDSKVHRTAFDLLPWLDELDRKPATTNDEFLVDTSSLCGVSSPVRLPVAAVFFLDPRNDTGHAITPLNGFDAVRLLAAENVRTATKDSRHRASDSFRVLTKLASACKTYTLSVGPNIKTLHEQILAVSEW